MIITSLVCSRGFFFFINDPEGPNLLIVTVLALILFFVSWATYTLSSFSTSTKKLSLALLAQIVLAAGLFVVLR